MKQDTISLRRRHLMIAGLAGIAAPAGVFAGQCGGASGNAPAAAEFLAGGNARGGKLVVSGRILGPDCKPLAGAAVEAWQAGGSKQRASATTDADGRFMFMTDEFVQQGGRPQSISYRVSHPGQRTLETRHDFAHTQIGRDEVGIWRTAVGLSLA